MKKIYIAFYITVTSTLMYSCKTTVEPDNSVIEGSIDASKIELAHKFVETINNNSSILDSTLVLCSKKFDGDRNVLFETLKKVIINSNNKAQRVGQILDDTLIDKSGNNLQIYHYVSEQTLDSAIIKGIVIVPTSFDDTKHSLLKVIYLDGTEGNISSTEEPKENYLVISENERVLNNSTNLNQRLNASKTIRISKASFTSMDAKRRVEPWALGEPEVRLNIVYVSSTSPANSTYLYPKSWTRTKGLSQFSKWNETSVLLPFWDNATQSVERKLIWTEEDGGTTTEKTVYIEGTDASSGLKYNYTTKVPATDKDDMIAESYIHFNEPYMEYNWGLIKFVTSN